MAQAGSTRPGPAVNRPRREWASVLILWLSLLGGAAFYADGWTPDNRIERWGAQLSQDPGWDLLQSEFGGDEALLLRLDGFDPEAEGLEPFVRVLRGSCESSAAVLEVIDAASMLQGLPFGSDTDRGLGRLAAELDLWSEEPPRLDLILRIDRESGPAERAALAQRLEVSQGGAERRGWRLRMAGHPLVSAALDQEARRVERTFVPLLVLLAALGAWGLLRSPWLAAIALLPAASASVGARAAGRFLLGPSDLILVVAGPMTFVLVLAANLHLVLRFQFHLGQGCSSPEAAGRARRDKRAATCLAALTTAVGFGVFHFSDLRSVSQLGVLVACTILASVPLVLLGSSFLLAQLRGAPAAPASRARPWRRLAIASLRRRTWILPVAGLFLLAGSWAAGSLRTATNGVAYFPADHPVRQQFEELEAEGASLSSVELLLRAPGGRSWDLDELGTSPLAAELLRMEEATHVVGPELVLANLPPLAIRQTAPALLRRGGRLNHDGRLARWSVRFATGESAATTRLLRGVEARAREQYPEAEVFVSGSVPRLHAMQDSLVGTLATSLALTLLVTSLLFLLVVRSARELLAAVLVNLSPVASVLAVALLLGIPLDGATTMVGAVVLGLAVDNTFHLLHAMGRRQRSIRDRLQGFGAVGGAASVGSLCLALGFGCLLLSGFAPTARFGGLCAVGALTAWAADLLLLPALLPWND